MRKELIEVVNKYVEDTKRILIDVIDQIDSVEDEIERCLDDMDKVNKITDEELDEVSLELCKIRDTVMIKYVENCQEVVWDLERMQAYLNDEKSD